MAPSKLDKALLEKAERLREKCQTTTSLKEYLRIATVAVEVYASATPDTRKKVSALALHAGKRTESVIENKARIPMSPQRKQTLDKFERTLDRIRQHIESIPERGSKLPRFGLSALKFRGETNNLKAELDRSYKELTSTASRKECILEVATIGTRAASALCDIPIPAFGILKPIMGTAVLICEIAKTVKGNREAVLALARHAQDVTNSVVERANKSLNDPDSVAALRLILEEIRAFLKLLQSRKRLASWIFAAKDKDRFTELNNALDRALTVFASSQSIEITSTVRDNTRELDILVATVHRVEDDFKRTMTLVNQCSTALRQDLSLVLPSV
ncbi:hypothetical protein MSAN_00185900 [Mycena sanguinolenta]|uniref:Uncharacterized protein n=1 Tax=Mycena sanguinolenta TaxID=230812 RepID=A0A8H6ZJP6_9AGAR|nr:hypothetical protein MSAN_00185900 [Mycena sanguinolenta]